MRIERDGHGFTDHHLLTILFLYRLIYREHLHVSQNGIAHVGFDPGYFFRGLVSAGEHDIHVIVWKNKAAGAGIGRHIHRDGAHAFRQENGHVAEVLAGHDFAVADRLTGDDG